MIKEDIVDLEDSFKWLDSLDSPDRESWLEMTEDNAMGVAHHGFGTMIRNELKLWFDGSIVPWFNSVGIYHADDMSSIILKSYHRKNNKVELHLEEQIQHYIDYWNENNPDVNNGKI